MEKYKEMFNDVVRAVLAIGWSIFLFIYIYSVSFKNIPTGNQRIVDTITGLLCGTVITLLLGAYFTKDMTSQKKPDIKVEGDNADIKTETK